MKFNPIRQIFRYDGAATIRVQHIVNPASEYGRVTLDPNFQAQKTISFPEQHPMMERLVNELVGELQAFAGRWRYFTIPSTPAQVVRNFVKQQAFASNPAKR